MKQSVFQQRVLALITQIPAGKLTTYAALAQAVGSPRAARAVGNALNGNPHPVIVPCHRVVGSSGAIGGYKLGVKKKIALLLQEGVAIADNKVINFEKHVYQW